MGSRWKIVEREGTHGNTVTLTRHWLSRVLLLTSLTHHDPPHTLPPSPPGTAHPRGRGLLLGRDSGHAGQVLQLLQDIHPEHGGHLRAAGERGWRVREALALLPLREGGEEDEGSAHRSSDQVLRGEQQSGGLSRCQGVQGVWTRRGRGGG